VISIQNKDLYLRKIESLKEDGDKVIVRNKDASYEIDYLVMPTFNITNAIEAAEKNKYTTFVVLNNQENLKEVLKNWKKIAKYPEVSIWFVNPLSNTEKKWIIKPNLHDKICDHDSLEIGLKTMSENVEFIAEGEFLKKI